MLFETLFQFGLALSILLCALVSGFVLLFAIVVMPGLGRLSDGEFLKVFKVIDGIIQENQPIFILVWVGSAFVLLATAILSIWQLAGISRLVLVGTTIIFLFGVQLPTITINVPLNNRVQTLAIDTLSADQLRAERSHFEDRWNRWNQIRTVLGILTTAILILLLMYL